MPILALCVVFLGEIQIHDLQILTPILLSFHSVDGILWGTEVFDSGKVPCIYFFLLLPTLLVSYLQNRLLTQDHKDRLLFSSGSFIALALVFRSMIYNVLVLCMVWGRGTHSLFCLWISLSKHHLLKDCSFHIEFSLHSCHMASDHMTTDHGRVLFLDSHYDSIDLYVCPYANTILSWFL